ncbi:MAG TPA: TonB family protein [Bryobacteraceae bacterium]|nr:TonB family protein [Bryobacteraceae bacterium]
MSTPSAAKSQSSATTQAVFRWTFPGAPIRIDIPIDLISRLRTELDQRASSGCSEVEVGGVLLGQRRTSTTLEINDYLWASPEQPGTRYRLDPSALERLCAEHSAQDGDALRSGVVGYFRTQARDELLLRDDEIRLVREHFQNPTDVVLLIQTSDELFTSGFLFWMREGDFAPFSFMDFPLDPGLLQAKASGTPATQPAAEEEMTRLLPSITDEDAAAVAESASSSGEEQIPTPDRDVSQEHQSISDAQGQVNQTQPADTTPPGTVVASSRRPARVFLRAVASVAAVFVLLAAGGLSAFLLRDRWSTLLKQKAPATVAAFPLQLYVEARGDDLNVRWNPQSAPITQARDGHLVILEGDQQPPRVIPLDLQQLASGHIYYRSSAERVQFQLEIVDNAGGISRESVLALSSPSPVAAPQSSPPQAGSPQVTAKTVQSIPIPSANAVALLRANTVEEPPKVQPPRRVFTPKPSGGDRTAQLPTITFDPPAAQTNTAPMETGVLPATFTTLPANIPPAPQVKEVPVTKKMEVANLQTADPIRRVMPVYPPMARQLHIQGTVRFIATIGKDGRVKNLELVSGNPALVKAATEAVKQWLYRPTRLNGVPVEMTTQIDLNFTFKP